MYRMQGCGKRIQKPGPCFPEAASLSLDLAFYPMEPENWFAERCSLIPLQDVEEVQGAAEGLYNTAGLLLQEIPEVRGCGGDIIAGETFFPWGEGWHA
jgi:hypothetical protein